jgi:hypothetical protein
VANRIIYEAAPVPPFLVRPNLIDIHTKATSKVTVLMKMKMMITVAVAAAVSKIIILVSALHKECLGI